MDLPTAAFWGLALVKVPHHRTMMHIDAYQREDGMDRGLED
jgi:hypothetical protein